MPIYGYACTDCGRRIEVKQSFSDEPLKVCTYCGGKLRRVFHPVGVLFKGSGFYSTDHRQSQNPKDKSKPEETAKADGATKKEKKAESSSKEPARPSAKTTEKSD